MPRRHLTIFACLLALLFALSCAGGPAPQSAHIAQAATEQQPKAAPAEAPEPAQATTRGPEAQSAPPSPPSADLLASKPTEPAPDAAPATKPSALAASSSGAATSAPQTGAAAQAGATSKSAPPPAQTAKPAAAPSSAPQPAVAKQPGRALGEIVYTEGSVELRRGERVLRGPDADIGARVLAYDLLITGPRSRAEIDLGAAGAGGALIKVSERSAFYFDSAELDDGARKSLIRLLAGSMALKVEKLGSGELTIMTGNATLGVRGTTFSVDAAPDGSLLVSCAEGRVACRSPDGRELIARPGTAVEALPAAPGEIASLAPKPLPSDKLGSYRAAWLLDREAAIAASGAPLAAALDAELARARPALDAAYSRLEAQSAVLEAWERLYAQGRTIRLTEHIEERKALAAALFDCLKALPGYERPFYRLRDLAERRAALLAELPPRELGGKLPQGAPSLTALFERFAVEREAVEARLGRMRRALFVFSRLAADSPVGEFFGEKASNLGSGTSLLELAP